MGAFSRFIAHLYTLFLVFFTVLFLELVILVRSVVGTIGYAAAADDLPMTTAQYLKLIEEKNPASRYRASGVESKECSVCLSVLEDGDEIRRLKCKHTFHKGCVDKWLEQDRATCPICRRLVLPEAIVVRYSQRRQIQPHRRRREFYGGSDEELILLLTSLHGNYMRRFM
ncbi:E3 ubiquitin-protein ligase RNF167-like [Cynara cardunculus var. scolymus]|uniref:E3 ubiquitin-protein ligase RNF167-like n=1 Tax=Cynara cardunculus var. scolymus TaxID=59895 RepID=UPI000D62CC67|nr:E3 ubiquitin-protein ligase RNF167-like [Cynara cardunculus var. scolymus]